MMLSKNLFLLFFSGISAVTLIDTLGAIASRKFNFKYEFLALFSFSVYLLIGFFGSKILDPKSAISVAIFVGLYDATVGLWLSFKLKAKMGISNEEKKELVGIYSIIIMIITSCILAVIGYALTYI